VRRLSAAALTALILAATPGFAHGAGGVFVVVDRSDGLPTAEVPNASGSVQLGPELLVPPAAPQQLSLAELEQLWNDAGAAYGVPWQVLAAVNEIESNFGQNMGPSSAGAIGWMQFLPSTWLRWGVDADGDGVANPWNAADAIYSAARYLAAAGGRTDIARGLFAYNHAHWYVEDVLELAGLYAQDGAALPEDLGAVEVDLQQAEARVAEVRTALAKALRNERTLAARWRRLDRRATLAEPLAKRLALRKRAVLTGVRLDAAAVEILRLRDELAAAEEALATARAGALSVAETAHAPAAAPLSAGDYVFPVGGGPGVVSVSHTHHDYPAADIAAPEGAPLYALTDGIVVRGWGDPEGRCGIGFTMRAADGRSWTYCHLSYLEPYVTAGALLTAGGYVGLVGSTGTSSSGPHLHLQLAPATSYPQAEAWFEAFAGTAFTWHDPARVQGGGAPVFEVLPTVQEHSDGPIVLFERASETTGRAA
jgi:murein DD-endopeptidase MepM/ murein hydrolase activator NlpD